MNALERLLADEIARRADAQQHLADYAQRVVGVTPAAHHRYICDELERGVLNDEWDDCVVCLPPGGAKSTYASHCFPAWFLGHYPEKNVILASHTATLAEKWSRRVRDTVASPEHSRVFDGSTLSKDSTSVSKWSTSVNGEFLAAGVGMSILGFRADCLTGDTQLQTETGYTAISDITVGTPILGYDIAKLSAGYHRVVAVAERDTDITYRIHTTDGRVVESTGNHPFFTPRGFVPADTIAVGDVLLSSVRDIRDHPRVGDGEAAGAVAFGEPVLLEELLDAAHEHQREGVQDPPDVQRVWEAIHLEGTRRARCSGLLGGVPAGGSPQGRVEEQDCPTAQLRPLWEGVPTEVEHDGIPVLLDVVQERSAQSADDLGEQPELAGRESAEPVQGWGRPGVQIGAEAGDVLGQPGVRGLCQHGEPPRAPCGRGCPEQLPDQRRDPVPVVSHEAAWCGAGETTETTVARVEVVRGHQRVWDIEVEGVHNFFANGVLTHNCAILDDPISGWEQAQSATQLQKIHEWFKADLKSRLKPSAKVIVICQRTAAYDMAGYLMKEFEDNPTRRLRMIILPMLAGEDDPLGRAPGERLWPEWYTQEMVIDLQKDEFIWKTMWQQEPPSDTGSWVTTDEIGFRPTPVLTPDSTVYAATDLALSVNTGDYTVHGLVAVDEEGCWDIIHVERARTDTNTSAGRIIDLTQTYLPREWLIDDDNASKVFVNDVATRARAARMPVPWKPMPMRGQDKETRAAPLRGQFKRHRVFMPANAPWAHWLVKELMQFPNATGSGVDDGIDMLGLFGRRLASMSVPSAKIPDARHPTTSEMTLDGLWEANDRCSPFGKRV